MNAFKTFLIIKWYLQMRHIFAIAIGWNKKGENISIEIAKTSNLSLCADLSEGSFAFAKSGRYIPTVT